MVAWSEEAADAPDGPGQTEVEFMVSWIQETQSPSQRTLAPLRSAIRIEGSEIVQAGDRTSLTALCQGAGGSARAELDDYGAWPTRFFPNFMGVTSWEDLGCSSRLLRYCC
jgi:hypothetical protein